jgi:putative ABC transport system permease protein
VSYRSPLAAVSLPRWVNAQDGLQSAAPALESARLLRMVGVGTDVLRGFGAVLLLVAALSVFIALYHAVREREADLAMLRMLGAPPRRVAALVAGEALWLAALGLALGLGLGQGLTHLLGLLLRMQRSLSLTGAWWSADLVWLAAGSMGLALLAAALPAWRAYRLDVTQLLQAPR